MTKSRLQELRAMLDEEYIDLLELAEIEEEFAKIPDSFLSDHRENAMAADMLDEIERYQH